MVNVSERECEENSESKEVASFFTEGSKVEQDNEWDKKISEGITYDAAGNKFGLGRGEGIEWTKKKQGYESNVLRGENTI